ncbi:MAG: TetR/AcrR family transcriptional regulator [Spirochaetia bacterium]|jgi:TetR/AcrR family transcriptional repressor of nem operon
MNEAHHHGARRGKNAPSRKDRTRQKIEGAAARLLRRDGIKGASVRKVMAAAGLTGGGFYAHFSSKERLMQDAFSWAAREKRKLLAVSLGDARGASYVERFLRAYLTRDHRDNPQTGCPYAALLSELPRSGRAVRARVRAEFSRGVKAFADRLEGRSPTEARRMAILTLCLAFGALSMSRTLAGYPEADELLEAAAAASKYWRR